MPEELDSAEAPELAGPELAEDDAPEAPVAEEMDADDLLGVQSEPDEAEVSSEDARLRAVVEAVIYVTEEPLTLDQMAVALDLPKERLAKVLEDLTNDYARPERGVSIREVAGGYKMATKPEHHEAIRSFVKKLKPPLKLSLAALETLAVIAYKQPITAPEIQEVRGVQGAGVLKTLIDRKLITPAGRKNVVGKPILYKTTKEFLLQFGLRDLAELPTLKEFEELRRLAFPDEADDIPAPAPEQASAPSPVETETETKPVPVQADAPEQAAAHAAGQVEESPEQP
ncbi:MAG: SMC-Scp complex subunit ScpB [Bryobacteraceae bacterium]|nr:SMC-Scp complex subunit ScpB [Bryobacteraceae bacterium]